MALETEILEAAVSMLRSGESTFHGFALAQAMHTDGSGSLIAHGTLYKALGRLEEFGLLESQWEDAPAGGRPRRRLYRLTDAGKQAAAAANEDAPATATAPRSRRAARLVPGTS